jgi:uncharacterized protein
MVPVVDTSVFFAGYLSRTVTGCSVQAISRWRVGDFQLVMSDQILEEIVAKSIKKGIEEQRILEFITAGSKLALNVPGNYVVYRLDNIDPDDNMLLAAAQEGSANNLVSLNAQHILPLKHHKGTQILNPTLFLAILNRELQAESNAVESKAEANELPEETDEERTVPIFNEEFEEMRLEKEATENDI